MKNKMVVAHNARMAVQRQAEVSLNTVTTPASKVEVSSPKKGFVKTVIAFATGVVLSASFIFTSTTTEYVEVKVQQGDTSCGLIKEYNHTDSCDSLLSDLYDANGLLHGRHGGVHDIRHGDVLDVPVVKKRFIK